MSIKTTNLVILDYDLEVEYEYQPQEAANYSYDAPYPGSDESAEVISVKLKEIDIIDLLSDSIIEKIENRLLELENANRIGKLLWS
jgi:hypothetical protein